MSVESLLAELAAADEKAAAREAQLDRAYTTAVESGDWEAFQETFRQVMDDNIQELFDEFDRDIAEADEEFGGSPESFGGPSGDDAPEHPEETPGQLEEHESVPAAHVSGSVGEDAPGD